MSIDASMDAPHDEALTYDYAEAAQKLGKLAPEWWLRRNITRLPHRKAGRRVGFTAEDLDAIVAKLGVTPAGGPLVEHPLGDLSTLVPSKALRQRRPN